MSFTVTCSKIEPKKTHLNVFNHCRQKILSHNTHKSRVYGTCVDGSKFNFIHFFK